MLKVVKVLRKKFHLQQLRKISKENVLLKTSPSKCTLSWHRFVYNLSNCIKLLLQEI